MELFCPIRDGKCKENCAFAYKYTDGKESVICGLLMAIDKRINGSNNG